MIRRMILSSALVLALGLPAANGQEARPKKRESAMTGRLPKVGTEVPELDVFDETGQPFSTKLLGDQHTVLVFGCLT